MKPLLLGHDPGYEEWKKHEIFASLISLRNSESRQYIRTGGGCDAMSGQGSHMHLTCAAMMGVFPKGFLCILIQTRANS